MGGMVQYFYFSALIRLLVDRFSQKMHITHIDTVRSRHQRTPSEAHAASQGGKDKGGNTFHGIPLKHTDKPAHWRQRLLDIW